MKTAFACLAVIAALLPTFAHAKEPNWAECKPYCVQEAGATKGVVVSGSNQQLLEVSVITPQAANAAFAQIKADKRIPFAFLLDGAYARSFAIGKQLGDRGIATAQAVVDGKLQFMSEEFGAIDWGYHIAPAVLIREKASIKLYVLDPSLTSGPVTYEEWRAIFLKTRVTKITDQYLVSRFVYGPEKTDTSTEYDPEALADMDETNQKYTELMAQVRAAQDEQADDAKHAPSAPKEVKSFRDCTDCPEMVVIPAGRFQMGSPDSEPGRYNDEGPVHTVNLKSFALAKTEVTQKQWRAIMGSYTGKFGDCGDDCPADGISWSEAQAFVKKLSERTGETYRLPSEAEWADVLTWAKEKGLLSARERIDMLFDSGTFVEVDKFKTHRCNDFGMDKQRIPGDGIVTGYGTVDGRIWSGRATLRSRPGRRLRSPTVHGGPPGPPDRHRVATLWGP